MLGDARKPVQYVALSYTGLAFRDPLSVALYACAFVRMSCNTGFRRCCSRLLTGEPKGDMPVLYFVDLRLGSVSSPHYT